MKIGVIDTDARFEHSFFKDKNIKIRRLSPGIRILSEDHYPFTHAEYVCTSILAENPSAEIILYNIVGMEYKKKGLILFDSISDLIHEGVSVINISLGIEEIYSEAFYELCEEAKRKGVLIVAAHCNGERTAYPASFHNVLGIDTNHSKDETNKFIKFDSILSNIVFSTQNRVSYYHLGQEHLMAGNSFLTGRITGILSLTADRLKINTLHQFLEQLDIHKINIIPDFSKYKVHPVLCLSNRTEDALQKRYAMECFGCKDIITWDALETFLNGDSSLKYRNGTLLLDINHYPYFRTYKDQIKKVLVKAGPFFRYIFSRYPVFSIQERMDFWDKRNILIEQLYL